MKIIGFVYTDGQTEMVLKGDSCLLNGRKPMFIPDWTKELGVTECLILRVSRLGKEIGLKFANRYYDAVAPGADFAALDILRDLQSSGRPWTKAIDFDYSLAIGEWCEVPSDKVPSDKVEWTKGLVLSPEEAISEASKVMTIRQGDLIYIQKKCAPRRVEKEDIIRKEIDGEEKLYCKIK
jgi:2-keto-4-pentenoate hydratase/2-oxohepta-3-ene-1,7-dioic acid hydratase in catechol pathway